MNNKIKITQESVDENTKRWIIRFEFDIFTAANINQLEISKDMMEFYKNVF